MLNGAVDGGLVGCAVQLPSQLQLLLPLCISYLLICCQQGIDFAVGVLIDGAAGLVIGLFVRGGVGAEAIQGDVEGKQDHAEFDNLVLVEIELFLHHGELTGGPYGWGNGLFLRGGSIARVGGSVGGLGMAGTGDPDQEGWQEEGLFHCGQIYVNP